MHYYRLTKPGIIYGNLITAAAGFFYAATGPMQWSLFFLSMLGIALTIAFACVVNNVIDRDIDSKMKRTQGREIPSGIISTRSALIFAGVLGVAGFTLLYIYTNWVTIGVLAFGLFMYLVVYTILKRRTVYFTYAGAFAGAVPPVAGYAAITHSLDAAALTIFLIMILWQMAHFYSISIYRQEEYAQARIPVMPLKKGTARTKFEIIFFVIAFAVACYLLPMTHPTAALFLVLNGIASLAWLVLGVSGFRAENERRWARRMFLCSLIVILVFSLSLAIA
jgi:protoheme IX farnesyltransferase